MASGAASSTPTIRPTARDVGDLAREARLVQAVDEVRAHRVGVREQMLLLDGLQDGQGRGAGQRIAAVGAAVVAGNQGLGGLAARQARADGEAAAQGFSRGEDVRDDAVMLIGEPFARSPDAGLDLVEDQQGVVLVAQGAGGFQIGLWAG